MNLLIYEIENIGEYFSNNYSYIIAKNEGALMGQISNCDAVFLKGNKNGVRIGKKILSKSPKTNIIFVSSKEDFSLEACSLHASGFIFEPLTYDKVQKELADLRYEVKQSIKFRCFGKFDILYNGISLPVKRSKAYEMAAYLIDKRGEIASAQEISEALFGCYDKKKRTYIYVLKNEFVSKIRPILGQDLIESFNKGFLIDPKKIDCDFVEYLNGEKNLYKGKYMEHYEWAETTRKKLEKKEI